MSMTSEAIPLLNRSRDSNTSVGSAKSDDEIFAEHFGMEEPEKSINSFQSFVLITNNIAGPGLMGLPLLYKNAGIIPVTASIIFICICSSLTGTLLSETIAHIPMNSNFSLNLEYSGAFGIIMGKKWYILAETFFLLACLVQVISGLVETAQSLDGFIDSYVLGETYAVSVYPTLKILTWSSEECVVTDDENCSTPFESHTDSSLIITMGYAITAMIFMPFGRGHIKETMTVQILSFIFLVLLLMEFETDFVFNKGLNSHINWFGEGEYSQLVGVILFNYAFAVTVPAWLTEKTTDTKINSTIWSASIFSSLLYITFGMFAALAFDECSVSMLTILSGPDVSITTRFSAAMFGLTIIGAGVPVFCVIIKNTLYSTKVCNAHWSFFFGSVFPYLTAWCLYKGTLLMDLLNWAGLVVNGLAAFCLPLLLAWWFFSGRSDIKVDPLSASSTQQKHLELSKNYKSVEDGAPVVQESRWEEERRGLEQFEIESALPSCLNPYRTTLIVSVIACFATAIISTIVIDLELGVEP